MPRRVERPEPERADVEALPVAHRPMLVTELRPRADHVRRAGQRGKIPTARHVIVVEVRLHDVADLQPRRASGLEIDVDITAWIDDHRDASRLIGDERAEMAQALDRELLQTHRLRLHRYTAGVPRADRRSAHSTIRALGPAGDPNDQHLRDLLPNVIDDAQVAHPKPLQPCPHHERGAGRSRVRPKCEHRPM